MQQRYTAIERRLLSIAETLKEFKNILLGYEIEIFTDHYNLTYNNITSDRVHCWQMYIKEFGPSLRYIKEEANVVADALSCLATKDILVSASKRHTKDQEGMHTPNNQQRITVVSSTPLLQHVTKSKPGRIEN
eukprot:7495435-Ditylum_brightwellii.AAC.2